MRKKLVSLAVALALVSQTAFAVEMRDVHVGGTYYHNAWNNNNKVYVLGVRGGKVKVQFLEGSNVGAIEWVPPRDLMTPAQSEAEAWGDAGEAVIGGAILLCVLMGCENEQGSRERTSTTRSRAKTYGIKIKNQCHKEIKLSVTYNDVKKGWVSTGWWNFDPNQSSYLADKNNKRLKTSKATMYYYAISKDRSVEWSGDKTYSLDTGGSYKMRSFQDKRGDTELVLTCDNM